MKYDITEEQLLIYIYGEEEAKYALENNSWSPNHHSESLKKFQNGQKFVWNWAAFFFGPFWFLYRKMFNIAFVTWILFPIIIIVTANVISKNFNINIEDIKDHSYIISAILATISGLYGEKIFMWHLSKKLKSSNFNLLPEEIKSGFILKMGITEEQFLSFIYDEQKAQSLIKRDIPNYYREVFAGMAKGRKFIWNWAAGIFSESWFLYRKMPHWQLIFNLFHKIGLVSLGAWILAKGDIQFAPIVIIWTTILFKKIINALLGNFILINHISTQAKNTSFQTIVNKKSNFYLYASVLIVFLNILPGILERELLFQKINILNISIFSFSNYFYSLVVPIIAIIYLKYSLWTYKKSIAPE